MTDDPMNLMKGARNLVVAYACVKKGENVCIYADTGSDPQVMEAIAVAAREAGGEVVMIISDEVSDPEDSGLIDPPKIVRHAFFASDIILSTVSIFKMQFSTPATTKAMNEYGTRLAYIGPNTSEELASAAAEPQPERAAESSPEPVAATGEERPGAGEKSARRRPTRRRSVSRKTAENAEEAPSPTPTDTTEAEPRAAGSDGKRAPAKVRRRTTRKKSPRSKASSGPEQD